MLYFTSCHWQQMQCSEIWTIDPSLQVKEERVSEPIFCQPNRSSGGKQCTVELLQWSTASWWYDSRCWRIWSMPSISRELYWSEFFTEIAIDTRGTMAKITLPFSTSMPSTWKTDTSAFHLEMVPLDLHFK